MVDTTRLRRVLVSFTAALLLGAGLAYLAFAAGGADGGKQWAVHDMDRPHPPVVTPGTESSQDRPGQPPSDAIVLFNGTNVDAWQAKAGGPAPWKVDNGTLVVGGGDIVTKQAFGDCQLHVEWASPLPAKGESQDRGNSGVKIMGRYEVQVLDSFGPARTYADGQAGALYGQYPPLVNPSRPPGQWQTFDIIFHAPKFGADGKVTQPATATVLYNGVLVQDHAALKGTTAHKSPGVYKAHAAEEPLLLQDHHHPVRYRNIWIRPLSGERP